MRRTLLATTSIPGLLVVRLDVHADQRGWFRESWQRERMTAAGLPDFGPVQHNVAFNERRGATRGIHAEPWDKLVTVASGRAFGAWVDLREGPDFGRLFSLELDPTVAVFVPRGVGNAYQTLDDGTAYSYLVNDHWRPDVTYVGLDPADPTVAVPWPVSLAEAELSDKDRRLPGLTDVRPVPHPRALVLGAGGQLGRELVAALPHADALTRDEVDVTDDKALAELPWHEYDVVVNAAAYTAVDAAETPAGRSLAWAANAAAPAALARMSREHRFTLVHYSTDYVFDGTRHEHPEDEPFSPLNVYGQTKAAGDLAVATTPAHYLLRTSWVVGDGANFVRTVQNRARSGAALRVVDDQWGRLTFADELARATRHLLDAHAPFGTYNVTNDGPPTTWADVARDVFTMAGRSAQDVAGVTTDVYGRGRSLAPRPRNSLLELARIRATGFEPRDAGEALEDYCAGQRP